MYNIASKYSEIKAIYGQLKNSEDELEINMLLGSKAHFAELAPAKVGLGPGGA